MSTTPMNVYAAGKLVAQINQQHPAADNADPGQPWLLLLTDGRVLKHPSYTAARSAAIARWAPCKFSRT